MLALARYALKSPFHAATIAGVLAILSLFIPLVSVLSGAIVGLIILTQGLFSGTRVIIVSIIGITAVSYLITNSPTLGITIGLVQWLPIMVLAEILRRTLSLSVTLVAGTVMAVLAVVVQYSLWPDSDKLLMSFMMPFFEGMNEPQVDMQQLEATLQTMVHWMTLLIVAVMFSTFVATLMAARWFQAKLAGSTGYRDEFYAIRLGQAMAAVALLMIPAALLLQQDWIIAMSIVVMAAFLYQGMAIVHQWSSAGKRTSWLVLLYVLMVIFPHVVALVALLGIVDNWMDFRSKLKVLPRDTD
jgi:hypothetical protein